MKRFVLPVLLAALFAASTPALFAADAKEELHTLVEKVKGKLKAGEKTEAALAPELAEFDTLLAEHKAEKTDEVANILFMKALLYAQVFQDDAKATTLLKQVQTDFPGTGPAKNADSALTAIAGQAESNKIKASLKEGSVFPAIDEQDLSGKPLSTAGYKGKVLMIDFWATWCGPCVGELPNVQKAYEQYHAKGFEIIGISLDEDRAKLTSFLEEKHIPWQQYFDGKGWGNKLAQRYGVQSIPATYLLDRDGKIVASDLRGEQLDAALAKLLK